MAHLWISLAFDAHELEGNVTMVAQSAAVPNGTRLSASTAPQGKDSARATAHVRLRSAGEQDTNHRKAHIKNHGETNPRERMDTNCNIIPQNGKARPDCRHKKRHNHDASMHRRLTPYKSQVMTHACVGFYLTGSDDNGCVTMRSHKFRPEDSRRHR